MEILLWLFQATFVMSVLCITLLFVIAFALSWSRAQSEAPHLGFIEILTIAGIEWGAWISLMAAHLRPVKSFHEAPPLKTAYPHPRQVPIIFIPSLHTSCRIFGMLLWRLKQNFCTSLWIFSWKSFVRDELLLKKSLLVFIQEIAAETKSNEIHLISFGTSRPVIASLLEDPGLKNLRFRWIAISAPAFRSSTLRFLSTDRLNNTFKSESPTQKQPDLLIRGSEDFFCYPNDIWGKVPNIVVERMGHYSTLLHSKTTQTVLEYFEMKNGTTFRHG